MKYFKVDVWKQHVQLRRKEGLREGDVKWIEIEKQIVQPQLIFVKSHQESCKLLVWKDKKVKDEIKKGKVAQLHNTMYNFWQAQDRKMEKF